MARGQYVVTITVEGDEYEIGDAVRELVDKLETDEDTRLVDWEIRDGIDLD